MQIRIWVLIILFLVIVLVVFPSSRFFITGKLVKAYQFIFSFRVRESESRIEELTKKILELSEENQYLAELIRQKGDTANKFVLEPARVMAISPDLSRIAVNRGTRDGLEVGMNVIARGTGLIGIVTGVQSNFSTIQTIFDPKLSIGVYLLDTREKGVLRGGGGLKLDFVKENNNVRKQELVLTSGDDNLIIKNLAVGFVDNIEKTAQSQFLDIRIELYVSPKDADYVFIIKNFQPRQFLSQ